MNRDAATGMVNLIGIMLIATTTHYDGNWTMLTGLLGGMLTMLAWLAK